MAHSAEPPPCLENSCPQSCAPNYSKCVVCPLPTKYGKQNADIIEILCHYIIFIHVDFYYNIARYSKFDDQNGGPDVANRMQALLKCNVIL